MMALPTRVLVADDNRELASLLKVALERAGYEVRLARNGSEALEHQRLAPAEVLVVDLVMPERDGFETIESFREEFPDTKVVVISGEGRLRAKLHLFAAELIGVDATLRKPFEVDALLRIVHSVTHG
jgi:DNA-binding response OmpR family regulator